jgi:DNA polymerase-3 subunit delta'
VGKLTAAIALARELLCAAGSGGACGVCPDCRKLEARALLHPDVTLLYPQGREELAAKTAEEAASAAIDLHALQDEVRRHPAWRILAEPARRRLAQLYLSPSGSRRRLLLVLSAERLNEESANALLKVLEEPPSWALILLLCENAAALLPTIRSRCRAYRFGTLGREAIRGWLRGMDPGLSETTAVLTAALSGGRPGRALELARDPDNYLQRRSRLGSILLEARAAGASPASALAAAAAAFPEDDSAEETLSLLADLVRDAMLLESGCDTAVLTHAESARSERRLGYSPARAAALLPRIERAREDLRRFVSRPMALESLLLDLVISPTPSWAGD